MKGSESKARHHVPPACAFGQPVPRFRVDVWARRVATGEMVAIVRDVQPGGIGPTARRLRALFAEPEYIVRVQLADSGNGGGKGGDAA